VTLAEHFTMGDGEPCTVQRMPEDRLAVFLHALHPAGFRDLRALKTGTKPKTASFPAADIEGFKKFVAAYSGTLNIYVGVAPRINATGRDLESCAALHALFVEFDFKDAGEAEVRKRLEAFPLKPSVVIHSGGGLHVYWFLTEPLELKDDSNRGSVRLLLRSLTTHLGADLSAAEPARILRVPGTVNHKYTPPRPVAFEFLDAGRRYNVEAFSIVPLVVEETPEKTPEITTAPVKHTLSRDLRMRLARTWLTRQPAGYEQGYRPDDPIQHGNTEAYTVCCTVVHGYDLTDDDAFDVLRDWNARCDPPWPAPELRQVIRGAAKHAKGPRGERLDYRRDKGAIVASSLNNVRLAVARLGYEIHYDAFAQKTLVNHKTLLDGDTPLDDPTAGQIWVAIDDRFTFRPSKDLLRTVLETEARHRTVHPVREYLDGLTWDGTPRLETWLITYGKAEDTPLVRAISRIVLVAAVRRVREPGCKFDELLILESAQGENKSTALRMLCPNDKWFSDDLPLGASAKEVIEATGGKWIIEASELVGSKRDADRLKSFLSRQKDIARLSYGHFTSEVPRQWISVGTINRKSYLKDGTGNRRFWPVEVQRFDIASLRRDRDQLWAEASVCERAGESIRLDQTLWDASEEEQKRREIIDPWEERLRPTFEEDKAYRIGPEQLWGFLDMPTVERRDERAAERVASIMQRLGFKRMTVYDRGERVWGWARGETEQITLWEPLPEAKFDLP
jgi:hypothetical protein